MSHVKWQCQYFCDEFYDEGYDAVVECWSDKDWDEFIADNDIKCVLDFVEAYKPVLEHRNEMKGEAF